MREEIKNQIKIVGYTLISKIIRTMYFHKKLEKKVVFTSFSGLQYSDNPKAISEKLHQMYPEIQQIWLMKKNSKAEFPSYIKEVRYGSMAMFSELMTAAVWVDNGTKSLWISKRKGQYFIQTWHGGLGFKKIGADSIGTDPIDHIRDLHSFSMTDVVLSNSRWLTNILRRAFPYRGEIWECGSPKNDIYFDEKIIASSYHEVRQEFHLSSDTKIFLYAPTFRIRQTPEYFRINFEELAKRLERRTGQRWVIFVRLHHWSADLANQVCTYSENVINATQYPDMQKITMAADMFMTDFSSGIFDFALLKRPGFLFARDLEEYSRQERGLYVDVRKMPFPFAENEEELFNNIDHFDEKKYASDLDDYFRQVGLVLSGHSSQDVCERIEKQVKNVILHQ